MIFQIRKLRFVKSDYLPKSMVSKSGSLDFSLALFPHPGIVEKTLRGQSQEGKKKVISSQVPSSMIGWLAAYSFMKGNLTPRATAGRRPWGWRPNVKTARSWSWAMDGRTPGPGREHMHLFRY